MKIIDVPDYYRLAADNFESILALAKKLQVSLGQDDSVRKYFSEQQRRVAQERLESMQKDPEMHDAMAVLAAVVAINEEQEFSLAVLELQNRHNIRKKIGELFAAASILTPDTVLSEEIRYLIRKMGEIYQVKDYQVKESHVALSPPLS